MEKTTTTAYAAYAIYGVLGMGLTPTEAVSNAMERGYAPPLRITISEVTPDLMDELYAKGLDNARAGELADGRLGTEVELETERRAERALEAERRAARLNSVAREGSAPFLLGESVIKGMV
jgi:hypothetical protein